MKQRVTCSKLLAFIVPALVLCNSSEAYTLASRAKVCSIVLNEAMSSASKFAGDSKSSDERALMVKAARVFQSAKSYWDTVYVNEVATGNVSNRDFFTSEDIGRRLSADKDALFELTKESAEFCVDEAEKSLL
jgi:hypothetical protein